MVGSFGKFRSRKQNQGVKYSPNCLSKRSLVSMCECAKNVPDGNHRHSTREGFDAYMRRRLRSRRNVCHQQPLPTEPGSTRKPGFGILETLNFGCVPVGRSGEANNCVVRRSPERTMNERDARFYSGVATIDVGPLVGSLVERAAARDSPATLRRRSREVNGLQAKHGVPASSSSECCPDFWVFFFVFVFLVGLPNCLAASPSPSIGFNNNSGASR